MRSLLIILLLLTVSGTTAQHIVEVVHKEKDDGLKNRSVDRVIRDDQGYFLLFFRNTIQRYDGKDFTIIESYVFENQNVEVQDITLLEKLSDGTIVMGFDILDYLFYLPPRENTVKIAPIKGKPIVNNGQLYMVIPELPDKSSKRSLLYSAELDNSVSIEQVLPVEIPWDIVHIAVINDQYLLQSSSEKIYRLANGKLDSLPITGQLIQRENEVYLFDFGYVYKWDTINYEFSTVAQLKDRSYTCSILKLDGEQNIIAAYTGRPRFHDRIYVLDKADDLHVMDNLIDVNDTFKDFYTDDAFYRWMLVGYNGMHIVNLLRDGAGIIFKRENIKKGEFGVVVSGVAAHDDEVIFARELQGLFSVEDQDTTYSEVLTDYTERGDYERNAKLYYHDDSEAYYSHAYRYDGQSDVYKSDIKDNSSEKHLIPFKLNDIYVVEEDNLVLAGWISKTKIGQLAKYNMTTRSLQMIDVELPPLRSIYYDRPAKKFWIGTYDGLYVFDDQFILQKVLTKESSSTEIKLNNDHAIMSHRYNDKIIIGTYGGGLYIIDPNTYKVERRIDENSGLTDNFPIGFANDELGHCWITTFNGVNVMSDQFEIIRKIYEHDGLPNREFNSKAIDTDGEGIIYGGTLNGLSTLDPKKVINWKKSFGIDITEILGFEGGAVERIPVGREVQLIEDYDEVHVKFNLPDYHRYPYVDELLDISSGGIDFSVRGNTLILSKIGYGGYNVRISPRGESGNNGIQIIRRSNWKRNIIMGVSLLVMALFAYLISRLVISRNKRREEEKTKLNKKISDLRLTSLQSQMNPHFIFNALGAVQYFIQTHNTERADEYLSNFAMLMRSILESSKSKYIRLSEEIQLLDLYVGLEKVRFDELFDYQIIKHEDVDTEINIPPMIIQPFVENAINHGLFNLKNRKGQLTIGFSMPSEDRLQIIIEDNGVGRKKSAALRMKNHKSRGTQIIEERIDTINQGNELKVNTTTEDLYDKGVAMGTKVTIRIDTY